MTETQKIYLASTSEARWNNPEEFTTREAAIEHGKRLAHEGGEDTFYIGVKTDHLPHIDADGVIDRLSMAAVDEAGDYAVDWLIDVSESDVARLDSMLNAVLAKWMDETCNHPQFWTIEDIEKHQVEETPTP